MVHNYVHFSLPSSHIPMGTSVTLNVRLNGKKCFPTGRGSERPNLELRAEGWTKNNWRAYKFWPKPGFANDKRIHRFNEHPTNLYATKVVAATNWLNSSETLDEEAPAILKSFVKMLC